MNIYHSVKEVPTDIQIIICCGCGIGPNGEVGWILESRLKLALELYNKCSEPLLILSGGAGNGQITEADAMENYILENYSDKKINYTKEGMSISTIYQLCYIKRDYIIPQNIKKIAVVSDEFHIQRISILMDGILGTDYEVYYLGSTIKLYGKSRQLIKEFEEASFKSYEAVLNLLPHGNHETFIEFEDSAQEYRQIMKISKTIIIPAEDIINFMYKKQDKVKESK